MSSRVGFPLALLQRTDWSGFAGDLGGVNYGALSPDESPLAEEDDEDEDSPVTTAFAPPNLWRVPEQELEPR